MRKTPCTKGVGRLHLADGMWWLDKMDDDSCVK
jgi:hypothetical protein